MATYSFVNSTPVTWQPTLAARNLAGPPSPEPRSIRLCAKSLGEFPNRFKASTVKLVKLGELGPLDVSRSQARVLKGFVEPLPYACGGVVIFQTAFLCHFVTPLLSSLVLVIDETFDPRRFP